MVKGIVLGGGGGGRGHALFSKEICLWRYSTYHLRHTTCNDLAEAFLSTKLYTQTDN